MARLQVLASYPRSNRFILFGFNGYERDIRIAAG
jgi:hypothetical protein